MHRPCEALYAGVVRQGWVAGLAEMRYILHAIERAKEEIELLQKKIKEEIRQKLQNYEIVIKTTEQEIKQAEYKVKKEQIEKHKLLNDDENEIKQKAAQELYSKFMQLPPEKKRHFENCV
jgi:alanyl-tRNA synthetase